MTETWHFYAGVATSMGGSGTFDMHFTTSADGIFMAMLQNKIEESYPNVQ